MHELRIADDLSLIILEAALREQLQKVTKVNLCVGEMVPFVPDLFETAFRETVRGTLAEMAEVDIEKIRLKVKCLGCGNEFHPADNRFECLQCRSADLEITHGKELFIKSIEGVK